MIRLAAILAVAAAPVFAQSANLDLVLGGQRITLQVAPVAAVTEARAAAFVDRLLSDWSQPGLEGARRMATAYDGSVQFYGRSRSHEQVMQDRYAFARRWPQRDYRLDAAATRTRCGEVCRVSADYSFVAVDPATGTRSAGRSTLELTLRPQGDSFVISAEDGTVYSRH